MQLKASSTLLKQHWQCVELFHMLMKRQYNPGAATEDDEAIAKSRGGNTTKIHLSVAACGYPVAFEITGGNIHVSTAAPLLLAQNPDAESVIADKGYDSEALREQL